MRFAPVSVLAHIIYALAWLSFGAVHSVLASMIAKERLHFLLGRAYRLAYNLFALFYIGVVMYGGRYLLRTDLGPFALSSTSQYFLSGLTIMGLIVFVAALFQYDLGRFSGVTQLLQTSHDAADNHEVLQLSGLNRYVRHPLYTGAHLYLWGQVRSEYDLVTAIWASTYLVIGSYFEERKLVVDYGDAYIQYKKRVPSVIPWRGRVI